MTTDSPAPVKAQQIPSKGDLVVFDPAEEEDRWLSPAWASRVGGEFLVLEVGPDRVLLWEEGPAGGHVGDWISCGVKDVRVVRSLATARREGAVEALREAAGDARYDRAWPDVASWLHGRANAIENEIRREARDREEQP